MHIPLIAQDHGRHSNGFVYGQDRVGSDYVACKAQFAHRSGASLALNCAPANAAQAQQLIRFPHN
jgi:hypothetical protein